MKDKTKQRTEKRLEQIPVTHQGRVLEAHLILSIYTVYKPASCQFIKDYVGVCNMHIVHILKDWYIGNMSKKYQKELKKKCIDVIETDRKITTL